METKEDEFQGYLSYNSINTPPMFFGVPIMFFVGIISMAFFVGFPLLVYVSTIVGVIFGACLFALFLFAKVASENDPRALDSVKMKIKGFLKYGFKKVLIVRGNIHD